MPTRAELRWGRTESRCRPGLILLETVLALALFILSVLLVGAAVNSSLRNSARLEQQTRGLMLAESLLAQVRSGTLAASENLSADFVQFPGYSYRMSLADAGEVASLRAITVTVSWQADGHEHAVSLTGWDYQPQSQEPQEDEGDLNGLTEPTPPSGQGGQP